MAPYAMTDEAAERAALGSSRVEIVDGDEVLVPDFTRGMASDLAYLELRAEYPNPKDFSPFLNEGTQAWREFFDQRKVVEREDETGQVFAAVTSNRVDVFDGKVQAFGPANLSMPRAKRFDVAALLTDITLVERFDIKGQMRMAMRNLAAVDTARAALRLRDHVRQYPGYERAEVVPGAYASSWKAARETVKLHAARFPPVSVAVNAWFIGKKLFMYGDPEDEEGWRVFGPEGVAPLIKLIHRMVEATTPASVAFALGPELTLLDIDIHDGEQVLCPVRERHAGPHDELQVATSPRATSGLSYEERVRLDSLTSACEVLAVDGENCATAVRVSARYVLVNSHVVNGGGAITCAGKAAHPVRLLSRDLWLARCDGPDVVWPLRAPVEAEQVVLCYRRHNEMCYGGPVRVLSAGADVMTLVKDVFMQPGVSGAAVVALRDFALLGVYDGVSLQRALAASYTSDMYTAMCTMHDTDAVSRSSASLDAADGIMGFMKKRGFGKVVGSAMTSLVPLYAEDVHVGVGFSANGWLYTACDPEVAPLAVSPDAVPLEFEACSARLFRAKVMLLPEAPAVFRAPSYGEEVFAIGRDLEGHYCSVTTGRVSHVGLDARVFSVAGVSSGALPFVGGLIIAKSDAAAVGVFGSLIVDRKGQSCVTCAGMPARVAGASAVEKPAAALARLFPFLNPSAWGDDVVETVVTHASAASVQPGGSTQMAYAMVGDSAMRTVAWSELLGGGTATSLWQTEIQRLQSNVAQAARCEELGLGALLRVGGGFRAAPGAKVYADLLEAVAGAVYLHEKPETMRTFCLAVGALPFAIGDPESPSAVRFGSMDSVT